MAYQMAATAVTLNDLEGHSPVASLFKCNPSNICASFYTISTEHVLALAELLVLPAARRGAAAHNVLSHICVSVCVCIIISCKQNISKTI